MSGKNRKRKKRPAETLAVQWHVASETVAPEDREQVLLRLPNLARAVRDLPARTVHVEVDLNPRKGGYGVSVSLQLPAKTLFAAEWARDPATAGRRAMNKVTAQVATYRSLLRRHERRSHRRPGPPFHAPVAAPAPDREREQVEACRARAARHCRHEIVHDPAMALIPKESVSVPDVVDEAMVWTLDHLASRPAFLTPEQFFWRRLLHQLDLARASVLRRRAGEEEEAGVAARNREPEAEVDVEWQDAEDLLFGGGEPLPFDLDEAASSGSDPAEILDREVAQEAVSDALRELPDSQRRTILLHDLEGYDPQEIAIVLSVSEDRVREDLENARRTLRRRLREYA
jgi:RNA polymerase sigma factor (sigma-70 family)